MDRLLIAVVAAALGFAMRTAFDAWKEGHASRRRHEHVFDALIRELAVLHSLAKANHEIVRQELEVIDESESQSCLLSPLTPLPTTAYDLVRADPPPGLLVDHTLAELAGTVANVTRINSIQEARQAAKSRLTEDVVESVVAYNRMLLPMRSALMTTLNKLLWIAAFSGPDALRRSRGSRVLDPEPAPDVVSGQAESSPVTWLRASLTRAPEPQL